MEYLILIIGFIILVKGADFFIEGASLVARRFNVSSILIGLTIVAFGTSAPEIAVSISAAIENSSDVAIGNLIGSSIFNMLIVIGISASIKPFKIKVETILKEFPFLILSTVTLFILALDTNFQNYTHNEISKGDGIILLFVFLAFLYYLVEIAISSKKGYVEKNSIKEPIVKSSILGLLGLLGIIFGGNFVVNASSKIAINLGMSKALVGLTIVAVGTSLPELVTSIVAARKGQSDIALGNAIGSNMFNITLVAGITALIKPISISSKLIFDIGFMNIICILSFIFAATRRRADKFEGIIMTTMYVVYMIYIIKRN